MKRKIKELPSFEELHRLLEYNKFTGVLTWKRKPRQRIIDGGIAGTRDGGEGHLKICINQSLYRGSRIIWKMMTGRDPNGFIDHIDNDPTNDRWKNLREATDSQNNCNTGLRSNNTSGVKGISWHSQRLKWRAAISMNKQEKYLGLFATKEEAAAARSAAARELHGQFARDE